MSQPDEEEQVTEVVHIPTNDIPRNIRFALGNDIEHYAKDRQRAVQLLEKVDRALWHACLVGSDNSAKAQQAYEEGAKAFLVDPGE